mmetsp:Transcript_16176/g.26395  ORF Transcript_16176/g.26395 Transcript_16176/m.26395 type:complete len:494 (-) Transcript_16176:288-1769(-)|eukprot:CAMPEP_0203750674 /NCGR_PEP_ID=MMETSP0098-20131031/4878_1 /ASSEMBLY_ACC=CAM_ASM_000208 /TAXON_ID=96639 /ORGANISM=" , Strain NY0313808BC1" /LENGTH=493 /DNA_ID=CAMNT_0050640077 /DNA_START=269 /DNA_END=1750 /DNA_ORIENTATION=+
MVLPNRLPTLCLALVQVWFVLSFHALASDTAQKDEKCRESVTKDVTDMYLQYPYPPFQDKLGTPVLYDPDGFVDQLNYYMYGGKRETFDGFRVLVAGCGTGTTTISLAHLLRNYKNVKIVAVDLSSRNLEILRSRVAHYQLEHMFEFHELSISELSPGLFGRFDYVQCHGVIHHMDDPVDALKRLGSVLYDDGAVSLMVYGKIGRTGITQMQQLLKILNHQVSSGDFQTRISRYRALEKQLPETNLFKVMTKKFAMEKLDDAGIVDMLLHVHERSYTIPEFYELLDQADLEVLAHGIQDRAKLQHAPANINLSGISIRKLQAMNELLFGDIAKHTALLGRKAFSRLKPPGFGEDLTNVPILHFTTTSEMHALCDRWHEHGRPDSVPLNTTLHRKLPVGVDGVQYEHILDYISTAQIPIPLNSLSCCVLQSIDGWLSVKQILNEARKKCKIAVDALQDHALVDAFMPAFRSLLLHDHILILSANAAKVSNEKNI